MNPFLRTLASPLLVSLVAGCATTTTPDKPATPIPATYALAQPVGSRGATLPGWKQFFLDARQHRLIAAALERNNDLQVAVARVAEARAIYGIQKADQLPTVALGASDTRARTPADLRLPGTPAVGEQYQVSLGIAAYELDFWGRVASLKQAALAQYLASEEARNTFTIALIASVADTDLLERELDERIALAQQTVTSREEALRIARRRFELGATSALAPRQVETLLTAARSEVAALERQRAQNHAALVLLVGDDLAHLPSARLDDNGVTTDLPAGLPAELLARRPDIRAAEHQLEAAHANIAAARAAFFPRIALTAGGGTASAELNKLFRANANAWSFVPSLSLPLFDSGRLQANLDLAEARKNIAVANYEGTVQAAFRDVNTALTARYWLAQQLAAQRDLLHAQAERARLAELRYTQGSSGYMEVLDARRELFAAEQGLVQLRRARLSASVALYRALGGGLDP